MRTHFYDLSIRVLLYKEDDQFVAHALDLDIPAYGNTEEAAKLELERLLDAQIEFATCKNNPEAIHFPAPQEFFERWEKANRAALKGEPVTEKSLRVNGKPLIRVYSKAELGELQKGHKRDFSEVEDCELASA